MRVVKLDARILRVFKIGVFVGVRKGDRYVHTAFFIDGKQAEAADVALLTEGVKTVPAQVRKAYREILRSNGGQKKRKRRKKDTP
jgi:hypothetical protein